VTERHSGTRKVEGTQDVHASTEPGWEALAGIAGIHHRPADRGDHRAGAVDYPVGGKRVII